MKITQRKQVLLLSLRPDRLIETAAARAMTVSTGVVREMSPAALVAIGDVSAEATGPTGHDVSRGLALFRTKTQGGHVITQHVGNPECWTLAARHGQCAGGWGFSSSSGLFTSPSQFLARRT